MERLAVRAEELEYARQELINAQDELNRIETLFDYVDPDYFEIANDELTLAQMRYSLALKKVRYFYT